MLWRWNDVRSRWEVCSDPGYYYNPGKASNFDLPMKPVPGNKTPCGNGYYGATGIGYVVYDGKWYGGDVWSGYHWLAT